MEKDMVSLLLSTVMAMVTQSPPEKRSVFPRSIPRTAPYPSLSFMATSSAFLQKKQAGWETEVLGESEERKLSCRASRVPEPSEL